MELDLLFAAIAVAALVALVLVYLLVLRPHLQVVDDALDKRGLIEDAAGFWARLNAHLLGIKTIILASIAATAQAVPPLLNELLPQVAAAPWAQVIDQRVATWISIICTVLIPITHATGMSKAASAQPPDNG